MNIRTPFLSALVAATLVFTACSSEQSSTGGADTSTTADAATSTSAPDSTATSVAPATATTATPATATTATPTTAAPSTAAPTTPATTPSGGCGGASGIPAGADLGTVIHGDIDGDLADDTVTEYSLDGVPHVHAQLATGGQSDAVVQIGFADHVQINFHDFDHSLGADVPPPVAVLAVGAAQTGTAYYTLLTLTTHYCIQPWHVSGGAMFVGHVSAQGPFEGLMCDGGMGHIFTSMTQAENTGGNNWHITTTLMHHNFTLVTFDAPQAFDTTGTEASIVAQYGDIVGCGRAPLFT
ncbi:MAG: hypothetical protein H6513_03920 [Acidimicrobiaceae bacterium]|nr:hypothetical protein [Ilumatobacter sp.]MCB9379823.1 hypothetical protein [Acidimicrobiaceae bacterium]MCO5328944.1 hypothetical protein [Ilumatobacteraceae bacterium]